MILQDLDGIAKNARAALIAVYYVKLSSLTSFEHTEIFGRKFLPRIIVCLDKSHNIRTRSNALKCFVKLCQQLILFGSDERLVPEKKYLLFLKNVTRILRVQNSVA